MPRLTDMTASDPAATDTNTDRTMQSSCFHARLVVIIAPRAVATTRRVCGVGVGAVLSSFISRATWGVDTKLMRNSDNLVVIHIASVSASGSGNFLKDSSTLLDGGIFQRFGLYLSKSLSNPH